MLLAVNNEDDSGHVADANKSKPDGLSPLHMAAMNGHAAIASELLGAGAEKDALEDSDDYMPDGGGRSPMAVAAQKGHANVVAVLLAAGADKEKQTKEGRDPALVRRWPRGRARGGGSDRSRC